MGGPSRIDQTPIRLNTKITEERQTPKTDFGSRIRDGMTGAAGAVAQGVSVAAPFVPGGAIISAAVSGVNSLTASSGGGRAAPAGAYGVGGGGTGVAPTTTGTAGVGTTGGAQGELANANQMISEMRSSNTEYLMLQQRMQSENQAFSTLSNVMKVRHDTAKGTIQNIH